MITLSVFHNFLKVSQRILIYYFAFQMLQNTHILKKLDTNYTDNHSDMTIFESLLTTFELSKVSGGSYGEVSKLDLNFRQKYHSGGGSCYVRILRTSNTVNYRR